MSECRKCGGGSLYLNVIIKKLEKERKKALKDAKTCPNKYYIGKAYGLQKAIEVLEKDNV